MNIDECAWRYGPKGSPPRETPEPPIEILYRRRLPYEYRGRLRQSQILSQRLFRASRGIPEPTCVDFDLSLDQFLKKFKQGLDKGKS